MVLFALYTATPWEKHQNRLKKVLIPQDVALISGKAPFGACFGAFSTGDGPNQEEKQWNRPFSLLFFLIGTVTYKKSNGISRFYCFSS
ncbi:hypothetical protein [Bifidobacterium sp. ESL0790]|uniref:hypothetical protein n=1 Tax=Bifidobacterium sp. ESL0790 TaxID=2983233 RepID=UPI0023F99190|nr:hypothetical protein [Bifidobacterium sp. ESL0790]WEV72228.1 hypothetical protein OZY47_07290 [Bifidobacterium sp. ESL0790]